MAGSKAAMLPACKPQMCWEVSATIPPAVFNQPSCCFQLPLQAITACTAKSTNIVATVCTARISALFNQFLFNKCHYKLSIVP